MILLMALLATSGTGYPAAKATRNAQARGTILLGSEISAKTWKPRSNPTQREVIHIEKDGRRTLLRLTEFK